jgi:hypothetical protein
MQQQQAAAAAAASAPAELAGQAGSALGPGLAPLYPPAERSQIQESWDALMRWSKTFSKRSANTLSPIEAADKVVVFGGGSFGTAMGSSLALKKPQLDVVLLLRDPYLCKDINSSHCNTKYLPVSQQQQQQQRLLTARVYAASSTSGTAEHMQSCLSCASQSTAVRVCLCVSPRWC